MSLFSKYVLKIFIKYILVTQAFITVVTMLSSAISHIQGMQRYNITAVKLIKLELITIPMGINSALPITLVVSSIVTVLLLMRSKELLAYVSLGGRISSFVVPFVIAAIFTAGFMIYFDHSVHPLVRTAQQRFIAEEVKNEQYKERSSLTNLWIMTDDRKLINISMIDTLNNEVRGIKEHVLNDEFHIVSIRSVDKALYDNGTWHYFNVKTVDLDTVPPAIETVAKTSEKNTLLDDMTSISGKNPKQLSPKELRQLIHVMRAQGLGTVEYQMLLNTKYANALSVIVLVILVVPIGINFSRRYSPVKSAIVSFAFGGAFWAMLAATTSLGESGAIPFYFACYGPHALFLIVGVYIIYRREKSR